jgi:hypothetical protein
MRVCQTVRSNMEIVLVSVSIVSLCLFSVSNALAVNTELLDAFTRSPTFKDIKIELHPEDNAREAQVRSFVENGKVVRGKNDTYDYRVLCWDSLSDKLRRNEEEDRLYRFLLIPVKVQILWFSVNY